jgi:hypothetical protein
MADLKALAEKLGNRVQPSEDIHQFTPAQLEDEIMEALMIYRPSYSIADLPKEEEHLVLWKAMSSCFYILAGKHAEQIRFKIQNDEYHGQHATSNFLSMADKYENMFNEYKGIDVNTVTRRQTGTGQKAPHYNGDTP